MGRTGRRGAREAYKKACLDHERISLSLSPSLSVSLPVRLGTNIDHNSYSILTCSFTPIIQKHDLPRQNAQIQSFERAMMAPYSPSQPSNMPKNTDGHAFLAAISSGLRVVVLVGPLPSKDSKDAKATLSKLPGDFNLSKVTACSAYLSVLLADSFSTKSAPRV